MTEKTPSISRPTDWPRHVKSGFLHVIALVLVTVVSFAIGAPMTVGESRVSDPMRSLRTVDELRLHVTAVGEDLGLIGLSRDTIHELLVERCAEVDIAIVEEDSRDLPVLHLHAIVLIEDRVPDAVTYEFRLSVNQSVHLDEVDDALRVPTYFIVYTGLEHRDDVRRVANRNMRILISRFVQERSMVM